MRVVTIANEKDGVGKTTTAVHVAAALGLAGHRVLVIDIDGQGHATDWLGVPADRVPADRSALRRTSLSGESGAGTGHADRWTVRAEGRTERTKAGDPSRWRAGRLSSARCWN